MGRLAGAGGIHADDITEHLIVRSHRALEVNAVSASINHVISQERVGAANDIVPGIVNQDAIVGVRQSFRAGQVAADEVALNHVAGAVG